MRAIINRIGRLSRRLGPGVVIFILLSGCTYFQESKETYWTGRALEVYDSLPRDLKQICGYYLDTKYIKYKIKNDGHAEFDRRRLVVHYPSGLDRQIVHESAHYFQEVNNFTPLNSARCYREREAYFIYRIVWLEDQLRSYHYRRR